MRTVAILPVKSFGRAKQRLGQAFPDRPALAAAMVADVLEALAAVPSLDGVIVELTAEGREKWLEAMRLATVFEEDLLQDLSPEERNTLGDVLTRLLRRVEHAQPDAGGRLSDLD